MTLDPLWLWLAQVFQPVSTGIAIFLFGFGVVLVVIEIISRILGD
jgi:hypothetical protein